MNSGRGGFRIRAKWEVEKLKAGLWQLIITEIPYQVQKSKLIEKIANLIDEKKLPMVNEILDESSQEIRIVIEPRSRNLRPEMLMETLFKLTDLEIKNSFKLKFYRQRKSAQVFRSLKDALKLWLEHRSEVLIRRSNFRYEKISKRINILEWLFSCFFKLR